LHLDRRVHQLEDAVPRGLRPHDRHDATTQAGHRDGETNAQHGHEGGNRAEGRLPVQDEKGTGQHEGCRSDELEQAEEQHDPPRRDPGDQLAPLQLVVEPADALSFRVLPAERLDQHDPRQPQALLHAGGQGGQPLLELLAGPVDRPSRSPQDDEAQWDDRHGQQRQVPLEEEHGTGADDDRACIGRRAHGGIEHGVGRGHVAQGPRHELPAPTFGVVRNRLSQQSIDQVPAHVGHDRGLDGQGQTVGEHTDEATGDDQAAPRGDQ
jgi:hypothetical protein